MSAAYLRGPVVYTSTTHIPGCSGKTAFVSQQDAKAAIRKYGNIAYPPYRCRHCQLWHNTTRGKLTYTP